MIRQIEVEQGAARRTAALMGLIVILSLAIPGVVVFRGFERSTHLPGNLPYPDALERH